MHDFAMNSAGRHRLQIAIMAAIVWSVLMAAEAAFFDTSHGRKLKWWESPVAALELARTPDRVQQIIAQGSEQRNLAVMNWNTYMDGVFILVYTSVFSLFAGVFGSGSLLAKSVRGSIIVAASFDYLEDFGLLKEFAGFARLGQGDVTFTRTVSLVKWGAFALALWLLGALLLMAISKMSGAGTALISWASLLMLAAAAVVSAGLFNNQVVSLMAGPLFFALLLAGIALRQQSRTA